MQNWSEVEEGYCSGQDDLEHVHRVCKHLQIPYDVVCFILTLIHEGICGYL
jgi:tRNA U34 2-thiouridine synthase MnmA/TrmU